MMNNKYSLPGILYNFCLCYLATRAQVWAPWDLWGPWDIWKLPFAGSAQLAGVTTRIRHQAPRHAAGHFLATTFRSHQGMLCPELTQSIQAEQEFAEGRTLCIHEEEMHVQGKKNGTIFCEIASCINGGNSLSFTCPEPIIKIHTRVIAHYCQSYCCRLSQMMNEARINVRDILKLHIIWTTAINLRHFTSLSKHNAKVRKDKCLLEGKKNVLLQLHSLLLSDDTSHLIFVWKMVSKCMQRRGNLSS